MATLEFQPSSGNLAHTAKANAYICDGHGDEVMVRTNRYLNDGHGLVTEVRGYGCPPDPTLATQLMLDLRTQYENNLAGRKTKGTTDAKAPVSHEHFFISWPEEEHISPAERHEIVAELIRRTKLKDFPCLVADHNNTDNDHIHISAGVFSLDGTRKLGMNNRLLYELRRQLDYLCYEHGYSIVENPKLFGSEEYKNWFYERKAAGDLVIHAPITRNDRWKKTQKEHYADAMGYQRRSDLIRKQPPMTSENRGTHFYCLPHLFDPTAEHRSVKQPLYIYAMDSDGERNAPIHLAFDLEQQWCAACLTHLDTMQAFPGKEKLAQRLSDTGKAAGEHRDLLKALDIGTGGELQTHLKRVGKDLNHCRQHIEEQTKTISEAIRNNDEAALEKARARKAKSEEREAALRTEYRRLKKAAQMFAELMDAEQWSEYTEKLLGQAASHLTTKQQFDDTIRHHFSDIGQLLGVASSDVDRILNDAKTMPAHMVLETWIERRSDVTVIYTRASAGISAIYQHIGDLYEQRAAWKNASRSLQRGLGYAGIFGLALLPLVLPLIIWSDIEAAKLDSQIAQTRQLAEDIRYHNKNTKKQLEQAKSKAALLIAAGGASNAALAWEEFSKVCDQIFIRQTALQELAYHVPPPLPDPEIPLGDQILDHPADAVRHFEREIKQYQADVIRLIERQKWEDAHAPASFSDKLADAQKRASEGAAKRPLHWSEYEH